jgi:hypothetical protein
MKRFFTLTVIAILIGFASMAYSKTLVDVPSGHWAEDAVQKLIDAGLIEGYPDGTFGGNRPMTRYEYAMVISRLMDKLDSSYCGKSECKATAPGAAAAGECGCPFTADQLTELKDIVKKLAAEFKDELAALKVKVDEDSSRIDALEKRVDNSFLGNLQVTGSIRQRIDSLDSELSDTTLAGANGYFDVLYKVPTNDTANIAASGLELGYELVPTLNFSGKAGENVTFEIGLSKYIRNMALVASDDDVLEIQKAFVDLDFAKDVSGLDILKVRAGYQPVWFGPYGMLVDNTGVTSNAGVRLDVGKDLVTVVGFVGAVDMTGTNNAFGNAVDGIGSTGEKDAYAAVRLGLNLPFAALGVNYLASGVLDEKGWGVDVVAPLLKNTPFLTELRGEYMKVTDDVAGVSPADDADDASYVVGLDVYKNKRAGLTVSYANIPAAVTLSSVDVNPFTEFDTACPIGLDVDPGNCLSYESGRMLFPAGFEGLGVEASYIVLGDVTLGAKAVLGNFAGGSTSTGVDLDGVAYPGYGALSITKPINSDSKFRVEYMQQGKDPILLNRVRGELLINF